MTTVGRKDDHGKPRWDLLPIGPVARVVDVLTYGAREYSPHGWRHVEDPVERYYAAGMRHLAAWRGGEALDPKSGLPHLAHAACNLLFLIAFEVRP